VPDAAATRWAVDTATFLLVNDHLSTNLRILRERFGTGPLYPAEDRDEFSIDGVEFVIDYTSGSTENRFYLVKPRRFAEAYRELAEGLQGLTIVELGIAEGGSTALLALVAKPRRLVAVELEAEPVDALSRFIERRGLHDVVRPRYGIDQGDRATLAAVVDEELDGTPIDVVIDDASHLLNETRTSFETLFPRVRPGGRYFIEDWNHDTIFRSAVIDAIRTGSPEEQARFREAVRAQAGAVEPTPSRRPLSDLVVELVLARASGAPAVAEVRIGEFWITVTRGDAFLDPASFHLSDLFMDHFGYLT
jgi:predicted O-methyltransferase YrrM